MDLSTTRGQARLQQRDIETALRAEAFLTGACLAALERQRGWQAEAELDWLLKQHGLASHVAAAHFAMLRQTIGAALIRAGQRLAAGPQGSVSPATAP
jgi:hypothetical protein